MDITIECVCPPKDGQTRHPDGDTVTMRDRLDFVGAASVKQAVVAVRAEDPDSSTAEIAAVLIKEYLVHGIAGWTLTDERGKRVEATRAAVRAFIEAHQLEALAIGDEVDAPYSEQVVLPLLRRAASALQPTPATDTTSPTTGTKSRKPRSQSSTTSTRTGDTVEISSLRGGVGSTSPSSASVA